MKNHKKKKGKKMQHVKNDWLPVETDGTYESIWTYRDYVANLIHLSDGGFLIKLLLKNGTVVDLENRNLPALRKEFQRVIDSYKRHIEKS